MTPVIVKAPNPYEPARRELTVATPTCCCCCCCCLVTTVSSLVYATTKPIQVARKHTTPESNTQGTAGLLGFVGFALSVAVPLALLLGIVNSPTNAYDDLVWLLLPLTFSMVFGGQVLARRVAKATPEDRPVSGSLLFTFIFAVCFTAELFSLGFLLWGQLLALGVPIVVGVQVMKKKAGPAPTAMYRAPDGSLVAIPGPPAQPNVWPTSGNASASPPRPAIVPPPTAVSSIVPPPPPLPHAWPTATTDWPENPGNS